MSSKSESRQAIQSGTPGSLADGLVRGRDTGPELIVRRLLHAHGYRFRLHAKSLPGKPDIVLRRYGVVLLVHGCFWHQHPGCKKATLPAARRGFWEAKLKRNAERDAEQIARLKIAGWRVLTVWECELRDAPSVFSRIEDFLAGRSSGSEGRCAAEFRAPSERAAKARSGGGTQR